MANSNQQTTLKSNIHRLWVRFRKRGFIFLGILFFLGFLELCGFLWDHNTSQSELGWPVIAPREIQFEPPSSQPRPYSLLKPDTDYNWQGIPVHINSQGFRTEEFALQKPAGTYRILNLGDSVAFGWNVRQEATYGKVLEKQLNLLRDGKRYEVINAGVPGWNLESKRNFLLQQGLNYQPDLVVLNLSIASDISGPNLIGSKNPSVFQWLNDHTYTWPFLTATVRSFFSNSSGNGANLFSTPPPTAASYFPLNTQDPAWDKTWGVIQEMEQVCTGRGIRFLLVAFPTSYQLNSAAHPNLPQQIFNARAFKTGINLVDLMPTYRKTCENAKKNACEGDKNLLFADGWMNPTALGHLLAASDVYPWIVNFSGNATK